MGLWEIYQAFIESALAEPMIIKDGAPDFLGYFG